MPAHGTHCHCQNLHQTCQNKHTKGGQQGSLFSPSPPLDGARATSPQAIFRSLWCGAVCGQYAQILGLLGPFGGVSWTYCGVVVGIKGVFDPRKSSCTQTITTVSLRLAILTAGGYFWPSRSTFLRGHLPTWCLRPGPPPVQTRDLERRLERV